MLHSDNCGVTKQNIKGRHGIDLSNKIANTGVSELINMSRDPKGRKE